MEIPSAATNGAHGAVSPPRIMLLTEDRVFADRLTSRLQDDGFDTILCQEGREGLGGAERDVPAVILFALEKSAGYAAKFCRAVRRGLRTHAIPILIFAQPAPDAKEPTRYPEGVVVLSSRPLDLDAVLQQVKPLSLRRIWKPTSADVVEHLGVCADRIRHQATVAETAIPLTLTEFRLLDCFLRQPGRAFSRADLISKAIGSDVVILDRTIDVHIKSLRRKLGVSGGLIVTVRGIGYRFSDSPIA